LPLISGTAEAYVTVEDRQLKMEQRGKQRCKDENRREHWLTAGIGNMQVIREIYAS
jgi:hypothetical protein